MIIRQEQEKDYEAVFDLIQSAFENEEYSDRQEQFLVERLRDSEAFVPELALVAEKEGRIVGYILLTKIKITDGQIDHLSLALAPVAVAPSFQRKGIGERLINAAHQRAIDSGFTSVVVLGHENYYPRFGYKMAKTFGIKLPFDVPDENCMVVELKEDALKNVKGAVQYPGEFFG